MESGIQNWYEVRVFECLRDFQPDVPGFTEGDWADVACLALNHLPPRYVRHTVDMTFYTSPQERAEMDEKVKNALLNAVAYVKKHPELETA